MHNDTLRRELAEIQLLLNLAVTRLETIRKPKKTIKIDLQEGQKKRSEPPKISDGVKQEAK